MRTILRGKAELVGIQRAQFEPVELVRSAPDWEVLVEDGFKTDQLRACSTELEAMVTAGAGDEEAAVLSGASVNLDARLGLARKTGLAWGLVSCR